MGEKELMQDIFFSRPEEKVIMKDIFFSALGEEVLLQDILLLSSLGQVLLRHPAEGIIEVREVQGSA